MTWWVHLLVRRVDRLRERCDVFERVMRAVGSGGFAYVERVVPLLLGVKIGVYQGFPGSVFHHTVNYVIHRGYDLPCVLSHRYCAWVRKGMRHRESAPSGASWDSWRTCFRWRKHDDLVTELYVDVTEAFTEPLTQWLFQQLQPRRDHVSGKTP
jgi:hypothetical protein